MKYYICPNKRFLGFLDSLNKETTAAILCSSYEINVKNLKNFQANLSFILMMFVKLEATLLIKTLQLKLNYLRVVCQVRKKICIYAAIVVSREAAQYALHL